MRYKILVKSGTSGMITSYSEDNLVTVKDGKIVGSVFYPYPYCLEPEEDLLPDGCSCYKTVDGIIFDDCGSNGFDFWYYVPETHLLFNIDILDDIYNYRGFTSNNTKREQLKIALKDSSKLIIAAQRAAQRKTNRR